jgi:hypothetical protein
MMRIWLSMKETIEMTSDTIKDTGNDTGKDGPTADNSNASPFDAAAKAFGSTASSFTDQAAAKAREYTGQGKDRAVDALDNVATLVTDAAAAVDAKLGDQYGGYIRQAADAVSGLANSLRAVGVRSVELARSRLRLALKQRGRKHRGGIRRCRPDPFSWLWPSRPWDAEVFPSGYLPGSATFSNLSNSTFHSSPPFFSTLRT